MNKIESYENKLMKKIKNKDFALDMMNVYEKKIEEMIVVIALKNKKIETIKENKELFKYSFLLSKECYIDYFHSNIRKKIKEVAGVDCFKEIVEKKIKKLNLENDECMKKEKNRIFIIFDEENLLKNKKRYYLQMKRGFLFSKSMELASIMFAALCMSLVYSLGVNEYLLSLTILLSLTFTFVHASGEYFEKIRFRYKLEMTNPNKIKKGLNFMSFCYFILFSSLTIILFTFSYLALVKEVENVIGLQNEILRNGITLILFSMSVYWHFRSAVYQKRYFMFQKFEFDNEESTVIRFLSHLKKEHPPFFKNKKKLSSLFLL